MTIVIISISILYFVLLNYYNDGMTIGKKLMKIKIVSANDKKLSLNKYLIRSLIVNSILANIISVILILSLSKKNYILYNNKISTIFTVIYVLCFIFIIYRNDGRGLHDLIAGTKVIDSKKNDDLVTVEEVVEKKLVENDLEAKKENIEIKKSTNKVSKKNNKQTNSKKNNKGSEK